MKTKKVRPVLVETKEKLTVGQLAILDNRLIIVMSEFQVFAKPQQLILISLEDEKIEVGDTVYNHLNNKLRIVDLEKQLSFYNQDKDIVKVIATQDQLSPELIQKLVDEYNNGGMKDFEIEIESKLPFEDGQWVYEYTENKLTDGQPFRFNSVTIDQDGYLHGILHVKNLKLVEKLICENCKSIHEAGSLRCYCGSTSLVPTHKDNKTTILDSIDPNWSDDGSDPLHNETWIDFRKLLEHIEILKDIETDQKYVSNLEAFLTKLSKSSTFAHKAHKELQRLSR